MVPQLSNLSVSPRHDEVSRSNDSDIPQILSAAWAECCPADQPLVDQLNAHEKTFLILFSEYVVTALESPLSASAPATVLSDILMTARHRLSLLSKQVSLSPNYVVIMTLLKLLTNLFSSDNMKYTSLATFMEAYPVFQDRSSSEKEKLFYTANWMHVLFQITTAKKNKGMVMEIVPKFVEGNGVQYVTGSGQTQSTKDRVTVYETEGNVKPIKRQHRKIKDELDHGRPSGRPGTKAKGAAAKRKATQVKHKSLLGFGEGKRSVVVKASVRQSHSPSVVFNNGAQVVMEEGNEDSPDDIQLDIEEDSMGQEEEDQEQGQHHDRLDAASEGGGRGESCNLYLPLSFAMAPPIPVRRSQSSFSKAASLITSNNENNSSDSNGASFRVDVRMSSPAASSYLCSPRECYLDVEPNGTMRKVTSASWGLSSSLSSSSLSCMSPRSEGQSQNPDYQLQMLREVSEDSDFCTTEDKPSLPGMPLTSPSTYLLPPYLLHQQSLTFNLPAGVASASTASRPESPHPRSLERCTSAALDEGEVDLELLEALSRQASSSSWLFSRSTSASSLSGRDSVASTVNVNG